MKTITLSACAFAAGSCAMLLTMTGTGLNLLIFCIVLFLITAVVGPND